MKPWRLTVGLVLTCAAALAQPLRPPPSETPGRPPGTPVPTESSDEEGPAVSDDAGVWNLVPLVDASTVIVRGRNLQITAGEVVARLHDASGALEEAYATHPELVQELVDRMVADRLLADEARRRGLEADPLVRAAIERALVSRLRALVINPAAELVRPTDDEVRAWYDAHAERFHVPDRRRARLIFLTNRHDAQEVLRLALLKRRGRLVNEFRHLAAEHNDDPHLRSMAGEVRDITPTPVPGGVELDPAVRAAVFEISHDGDTLSRLVEGHLHDVAGFFVINLVSRRRGEERTLLAQADWIRLRILMERRVNAERERVASYARARRVVVTPITEVLRFEPGAYLDAGLDAATDAPRDAAIDAPRDAPRDASLDAPRDAAIDAPRDAFHNAPRS